MRVFLLILICLFLGTVTADDIAVIAHKQTTIEKFSPKHLEAIFLKKALLNEQGVRWIPLNLNPEHPLRLAFSLSVLKQRPEELESYWNDQYFQGISPPYVVNSEEAMLLFVESTPGTIGYVLPCHLNEKVQLITRLKTDLSLDAGCKLK